MFYCTCLLLSNVVSFSLPWYRLEKSTLFGSLTLYPPMSTGVDIGRLIAETKRRIEFQNFKNTFCSKLHELSIAEKNISFHRSASEILSSQSRSFWKNWIFLNKIFSTYRQWRSFGLVVWYRLTKRPTGELDMFRKLHDNLVVCRK